MPKVKIPRKSTSVDMTAMCDVSFLLLTFFILTSKFKPTEPVVIDVPIARSEITIPSVIKIAVDKDGKIKAMGEQVQKVLVDGEEFFLRRLVGHVF